MYRKYVPKMKEKEAKKISALNKYFICQLFSLSYFIQDFFLYFRYNIFMFDEILEFDEENFFVEKKIHLRKK